MQAQVREMYLKVIDATIESARAEFTEGGTEEATIAHLETLKNRWRERLLQTQDFTEDPALVRASSGASASRARAVRGQVVGMGPAGLPVASNNGTKQESRSLKRGAEDSTEQANKRARRAAEEDDGDYKDGSDLGSSSGDSDIRSAGSDPEVDNYILAQHDRVRKGPGKWKVQLKEGIAHINGRDYLFNKATCDLDW